MRHAKICSLTATITALDRLLEFYPNIQMTTAERRDLAVMCYSLPEKTHEFITEAFLHFEKRREVSWPDKVSYPIKDHPEVIK